MESKSAFSRRQFMELLGVSAAGFSALSAWQAAAVATTPRRMRAQTLPPAAARPTPSRTA